MKLVTGQSSRRKFLQQTAAVAIAGAVPVVGPEKGAGNAEEEMLAGRMPALRRGTTIRWK